MGHRYGSGGCHAAAIPPVHLGAGEMSLALANRRERLCFPSAGSLRLVVKTLVCALTTLLFLAGSIGVFPKTADAQTPTTGAPPVSDLPILGIAQVTNKVSDL